MGIRVLIVDSLTLFRQGVEALLRQAPDIELVASAATGKEALGKAAELNPAVILVDTRLPVGGGELLTALRRRCPDANILVLTEDDAPESVSRAVEAGAIGYVLKDIAPPDLLSAIRYAAGGKSMVNPRLARHLLKRVALAHHSVSRDIARSRGLSEREIEVLSKLGEGLSNKEIAKALSVSESTVKSHLRSISRKLGVHNRAQAVAFAVSTGLVQTITM